ncbi:uncharacterized protein LOC106461510 isoform X3 [Limulus polyphemus]|uniref:Uncharacterized protein LOC106461510 isoform X3 n=1 Tax=Limulus polyphemus TaxID=6850 RepID=A0ABM1SKP2_LIMPO|nr:uncharacterized protein LOC106461510 isoform X3 [Limulus polyphemus]
MYLLITAPKMTMLLLLVLLLLLITLTTVKVLRFIYTFTVTQVDSVYDECKYNLLRFSNNGMEENRGLARDPIPRLRNTPSKMQRETTCSPYRRKKGCDEKHMKQDDNEKSEVEEQCFEVMKRSRCLQVLAMK